MFREQMLICALNYAHAHVAEQGGQNRGPQVDKFQEYLGLDPTEGYSWCACFVCTCGMKALDPLIKDPVALRSVIDLKFFKTSPACEVIRQDAIHRKTYRTKGSNYIPKPGDLVFFDFNRKGEAHHIGFVVSPSVENGKVCALHTVEGNTSASGSGSQTNGDGVYPKSRLMGSVMGYASISNG